MYWLALCSYSSISLINPDRTQVQNLGPPPGSCFYRWTNPVRYRSEFFKQADHFVKTHMWVTWESPVLEPYYLLTSKIKLSTDNGLMLSLLTDIWWTYIYVCHSSNNNYICYNIFRSGLNRSFTFLHTGILVSCRISNAKILLSRVQTWTLKKVRTSRSGHFPGFARRVFTYEERSRRLSDLDVYTSIAERARGRTWCAKSNRVSCCPRNFPENFWVGPRRQKLLNLFKLTSLLASFTCMTSLLHTLDMCILSDLC